MKTLSKSKLEKFKKLFLERQEEIVVASAARASDTIDAGGDEGDLVQANIIKTLSDQLSKREKETLRRIEIALHKIEDNSFGLCEECEDCIPEKRLTALPHCALCISCAEEEEMLLKSSRI